MNKCCAELERKMAWHIEAEEAKRRDAERRISALELALTMRVEAVLERQELRRADDDDAEAND